MSDNEGTAGPGWLYAQGDPPGTHRYWDGTAWQGEPVPIAPTPAPPDVTPPSNAPPPVAPSVPEPLPAAAPPTEFDTPLGFDEPPAFDAPPAYTPPGQPGSTFAPPPATFAESSDAKPKRSKWKWAVGVIAVLALGIGGCTYWFVQAVSGPIDVGNEYLAAIEAQDFDAAWAVVDQSCFPPGDSSSVAAAFAGQTVTGYNLSGTSVNSTNGTTTGTTSGTITFAGDDVRSIQILASKPDGEWSVCGFNIGGPGSG